jgi:hypothetical protein
MHAGGKPVVAAAQVLEARGVAGPVIATGHVRSSGRVLIDAREQVVRAVFMRREFVRHRSHDGELVGDTGQLRQVLGDAHARGLGVDRLKLAA